MIGLELTENHQSKLLEMCNTLFPESKIKFEDDYYCEWSFFLINDDDDIMIDENKRQSVNCHWFEFCMIHLSNKIFEYWDKINPENIDYQRHDFYINIVITKAHPIEVLYKQFQQQLTINK